MSSILNRMSVVVAVISVASLVGVGAAANARPQQDPKQQDTKQGSGKQDGRGRQDAPGKQDGRGKQDAPGKKDGPAQKEAPPQRQAPAQPQAPGRQPRQSQPQAAPPQAQQRLPQPQQQLITQTQQRIVQYGAQLDQQQRAGSQVVLQLQQQQRTAQYSIQLQYISRLHDQELGIQSARNYNYEGDPYFYTPPSYRYLRGGRYYETNEYGANVLRQAVNYGYQEGFRAGQADRQDHWRYDYQNAYAYQDGNYGYGGFYVDRDDYNYYFRQGFRRGYEDGYYSRYRYGVYTSGQYRISTPVLSVILRLFPLR